MGVDCGSLPGAVSRLGPVFASCPGHRTKDARASFLRTMGGSLRRTAFNSTAKEKKDYGRRKMMIFPM